MNTYRLVDFETGLPVDPSEQQPAEEVTFSIPEPRKAFYIASYPANLEQKHTPQPGFRIFRLYCGVMVYIFEAVDIAAFEAMVAPTIQQIREARAHNG